MKEEILFVLTFLFVFVLYQILYIGKKRRNSKKRPVEVSYLIEKYNIDIKKINYKRLLLVVSIISSFDITVIVTIARIVDNVLLKFLLILVLSISIIMASFSIIGNFYVKRGMIKDE